MEMDYYMVYRPYVQLVDVALHGFLVHLCTLFKNNVAHVPQCRFEMLNSFLESAQNFCTYSQ